MDVLNDVFTPLAKSRVKDMGLTSEDEQKYVHRLNRSIESTGTVDKVALGNDLSMIDVKSNQNTSML